MPEAPDHGSKAGRPLWWVAGLSLCLLVVAGLVAWSLTDDQPYVAPTPHTPVSSVQPGLASETLARFVRAVDSGDADAARALAPDDDPQAQAVLAGAVHNAQAADITGFTLRYVDDEGALSPNGDWDAAVDATWQFHGFDRVPAQAEVSVHLRNDGDRVALTGVGGGGDISPLWLSAPLQVRRTSSTLVLVDGSAADADRYALRARRAVPVVRRVLPSWHQGLVVEVPASVGALDRTLNADAGTYEQIAAVTTSDDGSLAPGAPVHVFANPNVFGTLKPTGAQVVMSHETTHVATGAWTSQMPLWILEGFADYVALRDVDLPLSRAASQIIAETRKDGPPDHLPDASDFGTRAPDLGATYESAWLANRLLAERGGEAALVAFYHSVDNGRPVGAALESEFGLSVADLTQEWRTLLSDLAGHRG